MLAGVGGIVKPFSALSRTGFVPVVFRPCSGVRWNMQTLAGLRFTAENARCSGIFEKLFGGRRNGPNMQVVFKHQYRRRMSGRRYIISRPASMGQYFINGT